jgi:membrane-bound metal-dependent hydrolase YbcI (DUF457 family)
VLSTLVNSITLCKTGESQLTRGEIWAEFAQLSVLPLATLVTLSLDMIPLFSFNGVTFCRKISNFYMGVKNKSGRSRLFTTCFFSLFLLQCFTYLASLFVELTSC